VKITNVSLKIITTDFLIFCIFYIKFGLINFYYYIYLSQNQIFMKKYYFLVVLFFGFYTSYTQPQELFRTWELVSMEFDMGGIIYMSDIDPPISPYLTIEEDLSYYGFVACNDYSGVFVIESNGEYRPTEVYTSGNTCEYQIHTDIEYM